MPKHKSLLLLLALSLGCTDMAIKEEVLKISGVSTTPNEYGLLPPGSLKRGVNVVFRRPGVLEALPAYTSYATHSGSTVKMFAGDTKTFALEGDVNLANIGAIWEPSHTGGVGTSFTYGTTVHTNHFSPGKVGFTKNRDRYFFTEDSLVYAMDAEDGAARLAGLPAPAAIVSPTTTTGMGPVILANNYVKYCALFFRDLGNGYSFRSAPSPAVLEHPSAISDTAPSFVIYWSKKNSPLRAGDYIEIYRTSQDSDPDAVPDDFSLTKTYLVTSTDITNGYSATIMDLTQDQGLGQQLYTNEFQSGASQANFMPPTSRDVTTFRGSTLYNTKSSWAAVTLSVPSYFGLANIGANGIGVRSMNVTGITLASAVVIAASAGDVVGIVPGLELFSTVAATNFPAHTKVLTVVGTTVTMDKAAIANAGAVTLQTSDVLTINGVDILMSGFTPFGGNYGAVAAMAIANTGINMVPEFAYEDDYVGVQGAGAVFQLINPVPDGTIFTVTGTHSANYSPALTTAVVTNDPRTNRVYYSKVQQPEAVGPLSYFDVGSGTILRLVATESCVYAFCTDGTYRITGDGVSWRVDPFDPTLFLYNADALDTMDNTIYAWTCEGLSAIDDSGSRTISANIQVDVRELLSLYQAGGLLSQWGLSVACDDQKKEVFFGFNNQTLPAESQVTYIYNTITGDITTADIRSTESPMCFTYLPFIPAIAVGNSAGIFKPQATPGVVEEADVEFNPLWASQLGDLKQWMSLVLHWGTITPPDIGAFEPTFDDNNVLSYPIIGDEETVVPVPRRAATSKRLNFGFRTVPEDVTNYFQLTGITVRYRNSSETLKR